MDNIYLDKVIEGDSEAFGYFVKKYSDLSYSLALGFLKNESEAEDAVQTSFFKAFKSIRSFTKKSKFSTWLYTIVVNECKQRLRKKRHDPHLEEIPEVTAPEDALGISQRERKKILSHSIAQLKDAEALVIRLYYLFDLNHKEISEITGFSPANAKVILYRARKNLREYIQANFADQLKELL